MSDGAPDNAVAIVGMAGRFPGAPDVDTFWRNLREGVESIRPLSDEELLAAGVDAATLRDPDYVKAAGVLDGVPLFDAGFFGVSPKDAAIMDPQHRHFLECAVAAFEHAGHAPRSFGGPIGVFAGCGMNAYFVHNVLTNPELLRTVGFFLLRHTGNDRDFLPTTVSYKLDLRGPSMAIQTACSTSLVAIHAACQSLLAGECDLALAGGVTILVPHAHGYFYRENEPVSPDGHCRPFDARAEGTVVSSGVGVLVLRRLADALDDGDTVHAVIRGSAVNNDGAGKVGYLAPSVGGHASVVAEALSVAGVPADTIDYVEAHGTGTPVGDPIEIAALTQAFRETSARVGFCRIGSVKSNIGHLDTAAGVASVIKVARALAAREMPATLHFTAPNPEIDFASSPFVVNAELRPWPADDTPRRAGVSSLGIGGTNAHVVLEEAPELPATDPAARAWQLLPLSARSPAALDAAGRNLAAWLRDHPDADLADVAFTLQEGREPYDHRRVLAARTPEEAAAALESGDALRVASGKREPGTPGVVFLFSGAGAQYPGMARDLYREEPAFRGEMDRCLGLLRGLVDFDLSRWMYPAAGEDEAARLELERPSRLCPAIFATEWALAALWRSWGVEPVAFMGHSLGEYAAACLAGVLSLEDALRIVVLRGALVDRLHGGAMLSVPLGEEETRALVGDELDVAAVNAPGLCVVSGALDTVRAFQERLAAREIEARLVPVNAAGHSRHLDPILPEFRRGIAAVRLSPPRIPYVSNVTGTWVRAEDAQDPDYWVRHFRGTVRFSDGLAELLRGEPRVLLEVGPGQTLCAFARQQPEKPRAIVPSLRRAADAVSDVAVAVTAFGRLWSAGVPVAWSTLRGPGRRRRIPLPTYPFEHRPYWIEPGRPAAGVPEPDLRLERLAPIDAWFRRAAWRSAPLAAAAAPADPETWLVFVDKAGLGAEVADRLRKSGHEVVTVREGDTFYRFDDRTYALAPEAGRSGYDELVQALVARDLVPQRIAHFWTVTADESFRPGSSFLHRNQECGFYSLLFLMQALGSGAEALPRRIAVISNGLQAVRDDEPLRHPEKATVLGPVRVIPREFAGVHAQSLDVELPPAAPARLRRRRDAGVRLDDVADRVVRELAAASEANVVAWRGNDRFEEEYRPAAPPPLGQGRPRLRDGGVYLVTGGLGGIGFALAEQLARRHHARLVLVGRSVLPPEERWDAWLASHGQRDRTSRRIRAIRSLREAGGDAWCVSADVADVERMREVVAEARERFGALHGVIHAAGLVEDGVIQAKTQESAERVFTTKLHGTLVLERLLGSEPLDFFAVFSSTSARLGPPGQVDYVAANAFVDAFAEKRSREGRFTVALAWGVWNEVGGATALSQRLLGRAAEEGTSRLTGHPLLGECLEDGPERWRWEAAFRTADLWVLADHRGADRRALLPGTGYLEIARAAWADAFGPRPVELRDVAFLAPLAVGDDEVRHVETELVQDGPGWVVEVRSGETRELHARIGVATLREGTPPVLDPEALRARCTGEVRSAPPGASLRTSQEDQIVFGPRWATLRSVGFGSGEAVAGLALDEALAGDLREQPLHPGLLDVATGFAIPLVEGWKPGAALFVPMGYDRIRVYGALGRTLVSLVRSRAENRIDRETAVFDVTIADETGDGVVEVQGYRMRRLDPGAGLGALRTGRGGREAPAPRPAHSPAEQVFLETYEAGIRVDEGVEAIERALAAPEGGAIVVSPIDLERWAGRLARASASELEGPGVKFARPELASAYEAPRDAIDATLVGFWEELLGVDRVGIHDDFFELGGHSLIAVRLFAKIKRQWGVDWPISVLFDAPSIAKCADLLRAELPEAGAGDAPVAAPRTASRRFLVPMNQVHEPTRTPFFLVAGMFGNVLNLRHLAAHLGKDQPVYALQAKGLYGDDEPHRRFEEMAEDYLREIRTVQPEGPYLLGGFSGGGITAFEMAHQLLAAGEEVSALILLDSIPPPPAWPEPTRRDRLVIQAQRLRRQGVRYAFDWLRNRVRWELEKREQRQRPPRPELTPAEFRSEQIELAFREALAHYRMRPYPGKIELFRPPLDAAHDLGAGRLANSRRELIEHHNWWQPWALGGVEVHVVPGNHDSMVLEPSVRVLAGRVRMAIENAQHAKPETERS